MEKPKSLSKPPKKAKGGSPHFHSKENTDAKSILQSNGFRATTGKIAILDVFLNSKKPLKVTDIENIVGRKIDTANIYRSLEEFEKRGVVKKLNISNKLAYFELNDTHHHHHIICNSCGEIEDIDICNLVDENSILHKSKSFNSINSHSLELFGVCKSCV